MKLATITMIDSTGDCQSINKKGPLQAGEPDGITYEAKNQPEDGENSEDEPILFSPVRILVGVGRIRENNKKSDGENYSYDTNYPFPDPHGRSSPYSDAEELRMCEVKGIMTNKSI